MNTKLITYLLWIPIIGLTVWLILAIKAPIDQQAEIKRIEETVVRKLEIARQLQLAYISQKGEYAATWSELIGFYEQGQFVLTQRRERDLGNDSVLVKIDTLGYVAVKDSLPNVYRNNKNLQADRREAYIRVLENIRALPVLPHTDKRLLIGAKRIDVSGVSVAVFEIKDPEPINPDRRTGKDNKQPLRVGSLDEPTTAGNWE
ncbi:hypothetical protein [Eisenibacter elegans]|uniref:hypothetical protein n=1 Tax=Eisenibacter elegans TaxID=997 RepID=UPI000406645C|nr:hypothetical protein [Eisenibacter elegans]